MSTPSFCPSCAGALTEHVVHHYPRYVCMTCGRTVYRNPAPAAGCIVEEPIRRPGAQPAKVLLAKRKFEPWKDHWYFPVALSSMARRSR
jgi:ribosomal protein S27AE